MGLTNLDPAGKLVGPVPWGVVCQPWPGDGRLLSPGPCPGTAYRYPPAIVSSRGRLQNGRPAVDCWWPGFGDIRLRPRPVEAVPLWWGNAVCPEGWDRARRVVWNLGRPGSTELWVLASEMNPTAQMAVAFAEALVRLEIAVHAFLLDHDPKTGMISSRGAPPAVAFPAVGEDLDDTAKLYLRKFTTDGIVSETQKALLKRKRLIDYSHRMWGLTDLGRTAAEALGYL